MNLRKVRVFVGSPGDVAQERVLLGNVIQELNRSLSDHLGVVLELREWPGITPGMGRPQAVILSRAPVEAWDVFVGILWLRFGSRSGASDPRTNKPYESGTEEEFRYAYRAWLEKRQPHILFYRATRPPDDVTHIDHEQLGRVKAFFDQFDIDGAHPGLYSKYQTPEDFERQVREHLIGLVIERHKAAEARPLIPEVRAAGRDTRNFKNPFIVGRPITNSADFHGRARQLDFLLARIATGQSSSIVGDGRIGKTSLLHHLLDRAPREVSSSYLPVFIDLLSPVARTLEGLLVEIQSQLGLDAPASTLTGFVRQLGTLQERGLCPLLALDEIDLFVRLPGEFSQDFCETLRAAASMEKLVLITASRLSLHDLHRHGALVSPLYNILGTLKLQLFTEREAKDFVAASRPGISFAEGVRREIVERSDCHPLRLQAYAWHAAQAGHEGRVDWEVVWKEAEFELKPMLGTIQAG